MYSVQTPNFAADERELTSYRIAPKLYHMLLELQLAGFRNPFLAASRRVPMSLGALMAYDLMTGMHIAAEHPRVLVSPWR